MVVKVQERRERRRVSNWRSAKSIRSLVKLAGLVHVCDVKVGKEVQEAVDHRAGLRCSQARDVLVVADHRDAAERQQVPPVAQRDDDRIQLLRPGRPLQLRLV